MPNNPFEPVVTEEGKREKREAMSRLMAEQATWRRDNPSRAEQLAATLKGTAESAEHYTERVIRAVCEWLRNPMSGIGDPPRDILADDIERAFLVER